MAEVEDVVVDLAPRREVRIEDEDEVIVRGVLVLVVEVVVVVDEADDTARPRTGGVAMRAGVPPVEVGLGVEGFDHDSKKSSSGCCCCCAATADEVSIPST